MTDIAANIASIHKKIDAIAGKSSRLKLIAVSKTKPASMMVEACQAGHYLFGENKVQEARDKIPLLPPEADIHLIGPLQSNKIKYCPALFSTIHSISKAETLKALNDRYKASNRKLNALIQMNLCNEDSKSGLLSEDELKQLLDDCLNLEAVSIIGLMTIPDPEISELETSKIYRRLFEIREKTAHRFSIQSSFVELSMGMSADYKIAVQEGSTFIRVGSAIFGERNYS